MKPEREYKLIEEDGGWRCLVLKDDEEVFRSAKFEDPDAAMQEALNWSIGDILYPEPEPQKFNVYFEIKVTGWVELEAKTKAIAESEVMEMDANELIKNRLHTCYIEDAYVLP